MSHGKKVFCWTKRSELESVQVMVGVAGDDDVRRDWTVHVEMRLTDGPPAGAAGIDRLKERMSALASKTSVGDIPDLSQDKILEKAVDFVDVHLPGDALNQGGHISQFDICVSAYGIVFEDEEPDPGFIEDGTALASCLSLPCAGLEGSWEALVFDQEIKADLLHYSSSAMIFSSRGVDPNFIAWNRVVLLYGPPGTGKTSLCRSLAQKLSIRLQEYTSTTLVEIHAHSIFSKWFSESGKLVGKLFARIRELAENPACLICVLIDEVESLTSARKGSASEPSDALRVVNALLTQIDSLRQCPNVLVLTTSNLTNAIDDAFMDRADIKQFIGPPMEAARLEILENGYKELCRVGIVEGSSSEESELLSEVAALADGMSGRALRKLPFIAHARFIRTSSKASIPPLQYLKALADCVKGELANDLSLAQQP